MTLNDFDSNVLSTLKQRATEPFYTFSPLPSQQKFIDSTNWITVFLGANRSGKSTCAAFKTAKYLLNNPAPAYNTPFWIVSKTHEMVGNIAWLEKLSQFINARNFKWITWKNQARNWPAAIGLKNGWVIEFKSVDQGREAFQGRAIGGCWIDEQIPEDVMIEIIARTSDYNAPIWYSLTPIEPDNYLQEKYNDPDSGWLFISMDLNENRISNGGYLSDEWVDNFIKECPEDFKDTRIFGKFAGFSGLVYKQFRRDIHVVDNFIIPSTWEIFRSIDFGFNNPFVCLWIAKDKDGRYYIIDEHYQDKELIKFHADKIKARTYKNTIRYTYADPEDAQLRAELASLGINSSLPRKDIYLGIEEVCRHLVIQGDKKPKLFIFKNCKNTIREIGLYKWPPTGSKNPKDLPIDKDNHTMDCLRYVLFSQAFQDFTIPMKIVQPLMRNNVISINKENKSLAEQESERINSSKFNSKPFANKSFAHNSPFGR